LIIIYLIFFKKYSQMRLDVWDRRKWQSGIDVQSYAQKVSFKSAQIFKTERTDRQGILSYVRGKRLSTFKNKIKIKIQKIVACFQNNQNRFFRIVVIVMVRTESSYYIFFFLGSWLLSLLLLFLSLVLLLSTLFLWCSLD